METPDRKLMMPPPKLLLWELRAVPEFLTSFLPRPFAAELPRGEVRLGVAGKIRTPQEARDAMASDIDDQPVFLAKTSWETGYVAERYPKVRFERSKERA